MNLKQHIESLFKNTKFSDENNNLFVNRIFEAIEKIDSEFVEILLADKTAKKTFFSKIKDTYLMNQFKLIDFFSMNNYFEESYTSYTNKIGLIRKDDFIKKNNDVVLAFPYKDCVLEGGQTKEDQKGKENFFNEILDSDEIDRLFEPKVLTNIKRYSKDGVEENPTISNKDNLILKGNNLLALHSLKKKYAGKVKLIYIDPPYNTGNDSFKYNDNFNHSTWLTFMKNRLEVARELLRDDGAIFISCDDNEQAYLKILMDEIFGRNNFINNIVWHKKRGKDNSAKYFSITHENLIVFGKVKEILEILKVDLEESTKKAYKNQDNDPRGNYRILGIWSRQQGGSEYEYITNSGKKYSKRLWLVNKDTMKKLDDDNRLIESDNKLYYKKFLSENTGSIPETIWKDTSNNANAKDEIKKLFGDAVFVTPKPEPLLERILEISTKPNDLVLDFFVGSGTTCAVAHKMGRQYIGIEQMDYIQDITVERMKKVIDGEQGGISKSVNWQGGGDFVYAELKQVSNFDNSNSRLKQEMRYLPIGELEDEDYKISKEEIAINKAFYGVDD
ncbi:site-specific DNA-methyltransferase [Francisella tularensis]|uniref:site-specific DNA-methyltransferase n=1 Tax=Francisella tularensis TaxID=263 RepID=UPI0001855216|nr:site-specific DNA-methyltransferase [Francisella tularensis]EDZ90389.1 type III restriction-modification system: methylase [Francisella tularensis subsp. novicida FTG]MBK2334689.1 site-specific DNA-methyltransferase [Francisella tularensis subsp. novicida]